MERESFEDETTADIINRNFIPIKVDREERPEVDSYYMSAVQGMTGQGGWPLTVFLTPDLKAFYGGTYFPPEPKYGMPSFRQVLDFVSKLWKDSRGDVTKEADRVFAGLQSEREKETGGTVSLSLLDDAFAALAASYDPEYGGFGRAPKFPMPISDELMLRHHFRTRKEMALKTVVKTLGAMSAGGIHDHLGGGFHRYSTDRQWLVPHFEKMLYDNALLASAFIHGYQVTGDAALSEVAKGTLGWMQSELEAKDGGFFAAQDADTSEGEGVYYTWEPDQLDAILGENEAAVFSYHYGVTKTGNFENGRTILHITSSLEATASRFGMTTTKVKDALSESMGLLYRARLKRPRPATDSKILTSWNGLAITSLAQAYSIFGDARYLEGAERAAAFILTRNFRDGVLLRRFAGGEAGIPATLEDYAFLGIGLLDLFEATSEPSWLEQASQLGDSMTSRFEDVAGGGFFTSANQVPDRLIETYDGSFPSGNAGAVMLLLRLSTVTGKEQFRRSADRALSRFQPAMDKEPASHAYMLLAADSVINGTREVVISSKTAAKAEPFVKVIRGSFMPDVTSLVLTDANNKSISKLTPLAEGRSPGSAARAFVCQNFACKLPAKTPAELQSQLSPARS